MTKIPVASRYNFNIPCAGEDEDVIIEGMGSFLLYLQILLWRTHGIPSGSFGKKLERRDEQIPSKTKELYLNVYERF